jgi:hypothetical protein
MRENRNAPGGQTGGNNADNHNYHGTGENFLDRLDNDPTIRQAVMDAICGPGVPEGTEWIMYPHPMQSDKHLRLGSGGAVKDYHGGQYNGTVLNVVALTIGLPDATGANAHKAAKHAAQRIGMTHGTGERPAHAVRSQPHKAAAPKHRDAPAVAQDPGEWWACENATPPDLTPALQIPALGVATHEWHYPSGLAVVRFLKPDGSKDYRQATKQADGKWKWAGLPKGPAPLYSCPRGKGPHKGAGILIHEGELAADAGAELLRDWCHLTAAGGSGRIPTAAWHWLESEVAPGAAVHLLPDGDEQGRKCMDDLAARLHGMGYKVHVVADLGAKDNGKGKDAADWPTDEPDGFLAAIREAAPWQPPAGVPQHSTGKARPALASLAMETTDLALIPFHRPPDLIPGLVAGQGLIQLAADSKAGKSFLATTWAAHVATGTPWFGMPIQKRRVLYLDSQVPGAMFMDRLRALGWPGGVDGLTHIPAPPGYLLDDDGMIEAGAMIRAGGYGLLVLDMIEDLIKPPSNHGSAYNADDRFSQLAQWIRDLGIPVLGVDHLRKPGGGEKRTSVQHRLTGSARKQGAGDMVFLDRIGNDDDPPTGEAAAYHLHTVRRYARGGKFDMSKEVIPTCPHDNHGGGVRWLFKGRAIVAPSTEADALISFVRDNPGCSRTNIRDGLGGIKLPTVYKAVRRAKVRGFLVESNGGLYLPGMAPGGLNAGDSDAGEGGSDDE